MSHSYTSQAAAKQDGLAVGYRYWFGTPIAVHDLPVPYGSLPSGQLISSTEDMAHYLIAQLNDGRYGEVQILSPAGIAELHRPAVEASMMGVPTGQYGMGWFIEEHGQTWIVWHSGLVPDFFAYMALLPEQKKGVVLLINAYLYDEPHTDRDRGRSGHAARWRSAGCDPVWLHPLGAARTAAHPGSPNCRCCRYDAAVRPLAPGSGASPEPWTHVGASYPAPADPKSVGSLPPAGLAGQRHASLYVALHA